MNKGKPLFTLEDILRERRGHMVDELKARIAELEQENARLRAVVEAARVEHRQSVYELTGPKGYRYTIAPSMDAWRECDNALAALEDKEAQ